MTSLQFTETRWNRRLPEWLVRRLCLFLDGWGSVMDAVLGSHSSHHIRWHADGVSIIWKLQKWHPAYWLGVLRTRHLGDKCGSAIYRVTQGESCGRQGQWLS